ncbi:MAG TPA: hypothetical protein VLE97_08850 [Gaiellaceae bacterium]|nr:hypothetical protein [Gaiellaceae bacterium]
MIVIDGPLWFVGALVVFGLHALYARSWRRERRADLAWWRTYDARSQRRHDEFMRALDAGRVDPIGAWNLGGGRQRGQA